MSSPDYDHDAAVQQMLDKVADRDSFFAFARELAADFRECYALLSKGAAFANIKIENATKCKAASVSGRRS